MFTSHLDQLGVIPHLRVSGPTYWNAEHNLTETNSSVPRYGHIPYWARLGLET